MLTVPRGYAAAHSHTTDPEKTHSKGEQKKKIAIVGSGCAGLGAAWGLKGTEYEIHLFEAEVSTINHSSSFLYQ